MEHAKKAHGVRVFFISLIFCEDAARIQFRRFCFASFAVTRLRESPQRSINQAPTLKGEESEEVESGISLTRAAAQLPVSCLDSSQDGQVVDMPTKLLPHQATHVTNS